MQSKETGCRLTACHGLHAKRRRWRDECEQGRDGIDAQTIVEQNGPSQSLMVQPSDAHQHSPARVVDTHLSVQVLQLPGLAVAVNMSSGHHRLEVICEELRIFILKSDHG